MKTSRSILLILSLLSFCAAHAAQIVVGQVAPMSGIEANQGRAYAAGMQLLFDSTNRTGGVNGHSFTLVRKDDGGRPEDTLANTRTLLAESKPMVLAGYFGSRNLAELIKADLLERERITLIGYRTSEIRLDAPWVYSVRATLRDEINKITEHLTTVGIVRLGLLYEDSPGAGEVVAAAEDAAKRSGAVISVRATYPAGTTSVTNAVSQFLKATPQAILVISTGGSAAGFIEQYRSGGGAALLFAHSGADIEQLSRRLSEEQMQGVAIAQVTPNPYRVSGRLSKEFRDLVVKSPPEVPVSYTMMEGFITAKLIVEAVRRQGARPSREGMAAAVESIDSLDLGGYAVSFKPGIRHGSRFVELSIVSSSGRIRQ